MRAGGLARRRPGRAGRRRSRSDMGRDARVPPNAIDSPSGEFMGLSSASRLSVRILLVTSAMVACGGVDHPRRGRPLGQWYSIQFIEASLTSTRPDGSPWHMSRGDNSLALLGGLVGLAIGDPSTGFSIGSALSDPGGDPLAPQP